MDIAQFLAFFAKNKTSDLHLSAGLPPMIRIHDDMCRINVPPLTHQDVHSIVYDTMSDGQREIYEENLEVDFSSKILSLSYFRVSTSNQNHGTSTVFRTIPSKMLSLGDLKAPAVFTDLTMKPRDLVLVADPAGSGKPITLAAMVNHRSENDIGHILTVENPIEFVHESKKSLINQRELGPHTHSFANALKSALREDPDVVPVSGLHDLETIRLALTAAEAGRLVPGTLRTSSTAKTIDRVADVFPSGKKEMVRTMLSRSLEAMISQTLLKTRDDSGRITAHEIVIATPATRHLIHENKVSQMYSTMQTSSGMGIQTLDQCLSELVKRSAINYADTHAIAKNPDAFANWHAD